MNSFESFKKVGLGILIVQIAIQVTHGKSSATAKEDLAMLLMQTYGATLEEANAYAIEIEAAARTAKTEIDTPLETLVDEVSTSKKNKLKK
jgi:hypothetical protein